MRSRSPARGGGLGVKVHDRGVDEVPAVRLEANRQQRMKLAEPPPVPHHHPFRIWIRRRWVLRARDMKSSLTTTRQAGRHPPCPPGRRDVDFRSRQIPG